MNEQQNPVTAQALKTKPYTNVDALAVFSDGKASVFALYGDGHEMTNCLPKGAFETTYEPIAPGQPPTWGIKGTLELALRDGSVRAFPFHVSESDFEKPEVFIPSVCGTDARVDNANGTLTVALDMHRQNPQVLLRQTSEVYRTADGVFERALKLATRSVRIVGEEKDTHGETRYLVQALDGDGKPQHLRVTHEDLYTGAWLYQFGGETAEVVRLGAALTSEWKASQKDGK